MDVEKVFHMTGGSGHSSYAQNSSLQKKTSDMVKNMTLETVQELYLRTAPKSLGIADLGCSSGPNTLSIMKEIIEVVQRTSRKASHTAPEVRLYLNDLPANDFNSVFKLLPEFSRDLNKEMSNGSPDPIYIGGYPGSFYGRLFPKNSLHFVYSSHSLHWLSRVPPGIYSEEGKSINKGSVYITESSPLVVAEAYLKQFQEDFILFLQSRSEEVISGGRMVLILAGRRVTDHADRNNSLLWELLYRSFAILVSKGEVEKEKLESYEVHFYSPSKDELEDAVRKEGSFQLDRFEMFESGRDADMDKQSYAKIVALSVRAIQESMIGKHFGEEILDSLFENYRRLIGEEISKEDIKPASFGVVLKKL